MLNHCFDEIHENFQKILETIKKVLKFAGNVTNNLIEIEFFFKVMSKFRDFVEKSRLFLKKLIKNIIGTYRF